MPGFCVLKNYALSSFRSARRRRKTILKRSLTPASLSPSGGLPAPPNEQKSSPVFTGPPQKRLNGWDQLRQAKQRGSSEDLG